MYLLLPENANQASIQAQLDAIAKQENPLKQTPRSNWNSFFTQDRGRRESP
ncbi:MAG: hypothetical protein IPO07_21775 [Haliscomenobacter sp.]|nr:hypothetical protein [Haliscomenobacter sp.]MBK9491123.1 hypothetical protein [Haliscomenobacter sp.]